MNYECQLNILTSFWLHCVWTFWVIFCSQIKMIHILEVKSMNVNAFHWCQSSIYEHMDTGR